MDNSFYVYALKDPRKDPALPFYVGKGTGTPSFDHLLNLDDSRNSKRILEIRASGKEPIVSRMVDVITENQPIRLEAELIAAFGTEDTGGLLTNSMCHLAWVERRGKKLLYHTGLRSVLSKACPCSRTLCLN